MKFKKEYLILAMVIAALTLYLVFGQDDQPGSDLPQMDTLDSTKINRMVITQKETALELIKKDERWFILPNNYPVNPFNIKNMVKAAAELTVTALVSESGNFERYDLNDAKRIKVQIYENDQMQREFNIGRAAPTFEHTFVLLANETKVYHAIGRLKNTFEHTVDSLRDKTALSFEKETITSLQIQRGKQQLVLAKKEIVEEAEKEEDKKEPSTPATKTQWQSEGGQTAADSAVNALLGSLSGLKCDDYMADDAKAGLSDAAWTVTLKDAGSEYKLSVFAPQEKEATQTPGTSSYNDFAFLLAKSRVETIEKQIDKLLNPSPEN